VRRRSAAARSGARRQLRQGCRDVEDGERLGGLLDRRGCCGHRRRKSLDVSSSMASGALRCAGDLALRARPARWEVKRDLSGERLRWMKVVLRGGAHQSLAVLRRHVPSSEMPSTLFMATVSSERATYDRHIPDRVERACSAAITRRGFVAGSSAPPRRGAASKPAAATKPPSRFEVGKLLGQGRAEARARAPDRDGASARARTCAMSAGSSPRFSSSAAIRRPRDDSVADGGDGRAGRRGQGRAAPMSEREVGRRRKQ